MKQNRIDFIQQQLKNVETEINKRNTTIKLLEDDLVQLKSQNSFDESAAKLYKEELSKLKKNT